MEGWGEGGVGVAEMGGRGAEGGGRAGGEEFRGCGKKGRWVCRVEGR